MPRVIALTATHRRPVQAARLLASLKEHSPALAGVLVVDNGGDFRGEAAGTQGVPVQVVRPAQNLGCGGGVALGLREAWRDPAVTHVWILDDDAVACPGALDALLAALGPSTDAAVPLVTDADEKIRWFPGPLAQPAWDLVRGGVSPEKFRAVAGVMPRGWAWAPWPSLLVTRRAVEAVGLPRDDFWFQGEDLEWTLRITARFAGVLAPAAECRHLPPSAEAGVADRAARERLKILAMLQNNAFTATRLAHGRRLARHAPGNTWRFLRAQRWTLGSWCDAFMAHWLGAVRGLPADRGQRWKAEWIESGLS